MDQLVTLPSLFAWLFLPGEFSSCPLVDIVDCIRVWIKWWPYSRACISVSLGMFPACPLVGVLNRIRVEFEPWPYSLCLLGPLHRDCFPYLLPWLISITMFKYLVWIRSWPDLTLCVSMAPHIWNVSRTVPLLMSMARFSLKTVRRTASNGSAGGSLLTMPGLTAFNATHEAERRQQLEVT